MNLPPVSSPRGQYCPRVYLINTIRGLFVKSPLQKSLKLSIIIYYRDLHLKNLPSSTYLEPLKFLKNKTVGGEK